MADAYTGKKITEITENTSGDDTDLMVVGNRGTSVMRRFTFANLAAYIRDKLTSLTFSSLNTSSKTLPGAINEVNNKLVKRMTATATTSANGTINLTTLTGLSWWTTPIVQIVVRTANANLICILTCTPSNTIWGTITTTGGVVQPNTEVSLAIVYCEF